VKPSPAYWSSQPAAPLTFINASLSAAQLDKALRDERRAAGVLGQAASRQIELYRRPVSRRIKSPPAQARHRVAFARLEADRAADSPPAADCWTHSAPTISSTRVEEAVRALGPR